MRNEIRNNSITRTLISIIIASVFAVALVPGVPAYATYEDDYEMEEEYSDYEYDDEEYSDDEEYEDEEDPGDEEYDDEDYSDDEDYEDEEYDNEEEEDDSNIQPVPFIPAQSGSYDWREYLITQHSTSCLLIEHVKFGAGRGSVELTEDHYAFYPPAADETPGFTYILDHWEADVDGEKKTFFPGTVAANEIEGIRYFEAVWVLEKSKDGSDSSSELEEENAYETDPASDELDTDIEEPEENTDKADDQNEELNGDLDDDLNKDLNDEPREEEEDGGEKSESSPKKPHPGSKIDSSNSISEQPLTQETVQASNIEEKYGHCDFDSPGFYAYSNNKYETYVLPTKEELSEVKDENNITGQYSHTPQTGDGFSMGVYLAAVGAFMALVAMVITIRHRSFALNVLQDN